MRECLYVYYSLIYCTNLESLETGPYRWQATQSIMPVVDSITLLLILRMYSILAQVVYVDCMSK